MYLKSWIVVDKLRPGFEIYKCLRGCALSDS